ncbi:MULTISPECIES: hypothetical protein [Planococcus]|uniref:DUF4025 domain-containing protein n=2 Tax=Planococcus TaxID=1372 RepID=A0ABN4JXF9_9BACL|nr:MULTISPECIES: hypothetical protein [Planococcus]ALS79510.1 hypothetical protein AUO94_13145 [Planococcus kocurii]AQU78517.1 hypothetical protein AJGP001_04035 [Planococcus faecalis]KAA0956976.1 hypothetical protein FQ085_10880 [Planococcus sp. ANT_H30]MDJ0331519.1 hypothetical protein [Planococcus sp. S3-L1]OHX51482.1 hypothetical protein BB777_16730 [Planococcus faecalis]
MARKGTAGKTPEQQSAPSQSVIDKAVKKTKEAFDSDSEATNYEDATDEMEKAKDYSKEAPHKRNGENRTI